MAHDPPTFEVEANHIGGLMRQSIVLRSIFPPPLSGTGEQTIEKELKHNYRRMAHRVVRDSGLQPSSARVDELLDRAHELCMFPHRYLG